MILAWGAKVSPEFRARVIRIAERVSCDPSWLMACMAFETGRTFSPSVKNPNSTATGLIQFMAATAVNLNTTVDALAKMSAVEQLDYVARYFQPYAGRIKSLSDCYMVILWPSAVGKPDNAVIFASGTSAYLVNKGLDMNKDGAVTKAECAAKVTAMLAEGLRPENSVPIGTQNPVTGTIQRKSVDPLTAISVFGPMIGQLIPQVSKIFGGGERAQQNTALASTVLDTVVKAAGAVNEQEAVQKMQTDPQVAQAVKDAVLTQPDVAAVLEVGGGIAAARQADVAATNAAKPFWYSPAFWISVAMLILPFMLVSDALFVHPDQYTENLRTQIVTAVLAVIMVVGGYYLGSSAGSAKKDDALMQQKQ